MIPLKNFFIFVEECVKKEEKKETKKKGIKNLTNFQLSYLKISKVFYAHITILFKFFFPSLVGYFYIGFSYESVSF